ncbi:MAG: NADH-quinone oxidoreductase subunit M [Terrimonas sp.]|nr:NADH-quinone oxidoreductase subunit M [Terrimonas sp.]
MIAVLMILIPLLGGIISFFLKKGNTARSFSLLSAVVTMVIMLYGMLAPKGTTLLSFSADWLPMLGTRFSLEADGIARVLTLLTAIAYPLILVSTWQHTYKNANRFFGFMLLTQAGLMGVFLATDALLFYFFWELALIPVYFLCSIWGGERRIPVTFKFFIYTFIGSLLMLVGIIYVYSKTADHSFALDSFYHATLTGGEQSWLFWMFFVAFAIKMPIFPFHSWQPDTYEQSPTATTMVLSGLMVKMGIFAVIRWLLPLLPVGVNNWAVSVSFLSVIGIIYASLIALKQDDMKRLIAYSSIAHIGLMSLALFANNNVGMQGVVIQMFNHGINIIALWIVVEMIEQQFGTRKMSELGGIAQKAPALALLFVIVALANIALPLTNGFVGEFLMFNGIFTSTAYDGNYTLFGTWHLNAANLGIIFTILAGIGIILSAVYTLRAIQKVLYGETNNLTAGGRDIKVNEKWVLAVIVAVIIIIGIYPQPLLDVSHGAVTEVLQKADIGNLIKK